MDKDKGKRFTSKFCYLHYKTVSCIPRNLNRQNGRSYFEKTLHNSEQIFEAGAASALTSEARMTVPMKIKTCYYQEEFLVS